MQEVQPLGVRRRRNRASCSEIKRREVWSLFNASGSILETLLAQLDQLGSGTWDKPRFHCASLRCFWFYLGKTKVFECRIPEGFPTWETAKEIESLHLQAALHFGRISANKTTIMHGVWLQKYKGISLFLKYWNPHKNPWKELLLRHWCIQTLLIFKISSVRNSLSFTWPFPQ